MLVCLDPYASLHIYIHPDTDVNGVPTIPLKSITKLLLAQKHANDDHNQMDDTCCDL